MEKTAAARKTPAKSTRKSPARKDPAESTRKAPARSTRKAPEKKAPARSTRKTPAEKAPARTPEEKGMAPTEARFADFSCFFAAWEAYGEASSNIQENTELVKDHYLPHLLAGVKLVKQLLPGFHSCVEKFIDPLIKARQIGRIATHRKAIERGNFAEQAVASGTFTRACFSRMYTKGDLPNSVFTGKSRTAGRQIFQATKEDDPVGRVRALAGVPSVSSLKKPRQWIQKAADILGAGLTDFEKTVVASKSAVNMAQEVKRVDAQLENADPMDPKSVKLKAKKRKISERIQETAKDSPNPEVVLGAAVAEVSDDKKKGILGRLPLSAEQQDALIVQGRAIIAAGAGSGKTRVLAGKVVWHMEELGLEPRQIMACSFTKKSSAELIKRVQEYGGAITEGIDKQAKDGFGTTHSIAIQMLRSHNAKYRRADVIQGWGQVDIIRLAIMQVIMDAPGGSWPKPDREDTFFPVIAGAEADPSEVRIKELEKVFNTLEVFLDRTERWLLSEGKEPGAWLEQARTVISKWRSLRVDPEDMSQYEKDVINRILGYAVGGSRYERTSTRKHLERSGLGDYKLASQVDRTAAQDDDDEDRWPPFKDEVAKKYPKWGTTPARQWFNIGASWDSDFNEGSKEKPEYIPVGRFALYISKRKGQLIAPGKDAHEEFERGLEEMEHVDSGEDDYTGGAAGRIRGGGEEELSAGSVSVFSAVYGAYEWLKRQLGEEQKKVYGDFDDMLINGAREMLEDSALRGQMQNRFKAILVDEAQDLNKAQHLFIGLVAGNYDPKTQAPYPDGRMTADTLAFIGDDKQSIYEFRGADPEVFIEKSELDPDSTEKFDTKLLRMNYRSGKAIVDAANKLIAYNKKQIKMVCEANVERKGEGDIREVVINGDVENLAPAVADDIADLTRGEDGAKFKNFGIAVRTNKEAYQYGIEMIKRKIPFRSKYNFFKGPAGKVLSLMKIASAGQAARKMPVKKSQQVVLDLLSSFNWGVGKMALKTAMQDVKGKNWIDYLVGGGWNNIYQTRRRNEEYVKPLVDMLVTLMQIGEDSKERLTANDLLAQILDMSAGQDGKSIRDNLVENVKNSPKAMEDIAAGTPQEGEGITSLQDAIREYALGPLGIIQHAAGTTGNIEEFSKYMDDLEKLNNKLHKTDDPDDKKFDLDVDAVQLDTVHGWKGLEAPHLYIPMWEGGTKGGFPHPRSSSPEDIASERRLAYVAFTRGEDSVTIVRPSHAGVMKVGRQIVPAPTKPSRFVQEGCVKGGNFAGLEAKVQELEEKEKKKKAPAKRKRKTTKKGSWLDGVRTDALFNRSAAGTPQEELEAAWWGAK